MPFHGKGGTADFFWRYRHSETFFLLNVGLFACGILAPTPACPGMDTVGVPPTVPPGSGAGGAVLCVDLRAGAGHRSRKAGTLHSALQGRLGRHWVTFGGPGSPQEV